MTSTSRDLAPDVRARILEAARREPSATRRTVVARGAVVLTVALALAVAIFVQLGAVRVTGRPSSLVLETALGATLLAAASAWLALGRGRSMLGRPRTWILVAVLAVPMALLAWKVGISALYEGMSVRWPDRIGYRCRTLSSAVAAAPLVALLFLRRRSDPSHPAATGAALGLAAGSLSWVLVDLWCPVAYLPHLLLGHVLPLVAVTIAGALLGRRLVALEDVSRGAGTPRDH